MQHTCKDFESLKKYLFLNEKKFKKKKSEVKEGFEERARKVLLTSGLGSYRGPKVQQEIAPKKAQKNTL
jgi:hypothetical protein